MDNEEEQKQEDLDEQDEQLNSVKEVRLI